MYASSTAGLFYFMNSNISRDNWTRGAATTKLSAYGAVCLPRAIPYRTVSYRIVRTYHHRITVASRRDAVAGRVTVALAGSTHGATSRFCQTMPKSEKEVRESAQAAFAFGRSKDSLTHVPRQSRRIWRAAI